MRELTANTALVWALLLAASGCGGESEPGGTATGGGGPSGPCGPGEVATIGSCNDVCPAGELAGDDGVCQPAGIPAASCAAGFIHDGGALCEPTLPSAPCAAGEIAVPGDAACRPVGACGDGTWGDVPIDINTVFVDGNYAGGSSDGTEAQPFITISDAVGAVNTGGVVAIAAGSYVEDVLLQGKAVTLWGRCPSMVEIRGTAAGVGTVFVRGGASASAIRGLAVSGPNLGVVVSGAEDVVIDEVWIHDTGWRGLNVENTLGPASVQLSRSLIENASEVGAYALGVTLLVEASAIRGTRSAQAGARGVNVQLDGPGGIPAEVTLRGSLVEQNADVGVRVWGARLLLEGSVVRDITALAGLFGFGIDVNSDPAGRGSAEVRQSLVERVVSGGISAKGADLLIHATAVRDVAPEPETGMVGRGIDMRNEPGVGRGNLTVSWSTVERTIGGIGIAGSEALVEGVLVRDQLSAGETGRGLQIQDDLETGDVPVVTLRGLVVEGAQEAGIVLIAAEGQVEATRVSGIEGSGVTVQSASARGNVSLRGLLVENVTGMGVAVLGADATLEDSTIRDVAAAGPLGRGVNVQYSVVTQQRAGATIRHSLVERTNELGIVAIGSDALVEDCVIRDVNPLPNGKLGDGVSALAMLGSVSMSVHRSVISNNTRAGISNFGSLVQLVDNTLDCNTIQLNGETLTEPPTFDNQGGNVCSCGEQSEDCKVLSSQLEPPSVPDN